MRSHPLILLLLTSHLAFGQSPKARDYYAVAEKYYNTANATPATDSLALANYRLVITWATTHPVPDSVVADCYLKSGIITMSAGQPRLAIPFFVRAAGFSGPPTITFQGRIYAGSCYYEDYRLDSALFFYRQAELLLDRYPAMPDQQRLYNKLGVFYYETGDYRRGITYFKKALLILENSAHPEPFLQVNYRNNIASALMKLGQYQDAIDTFKRLLPSKQYEREITYNIGGALLDARKPAEALQWLRRANYSTRSGHNLMARTWLALGRPDSAQTYLLPGAGIGDVDEAMREKLLGDVYRAANAHQQALSCYQRGIILLARDFTDSNVHSNPTQFAGARQSAGLFDILMAKARTFTLLAANKPDGNALVSAFAAYEAAIALARHVQRTYLSDPARLFLATKVAPACAEAVETGTLLLHLRHDTLVFQRLLQIVEFSKASVLQVRLGDPEPRLLTPAGAALASRQKEKKAEAARLELALATARITVEAKALQDKLRENELAISQLQDRLDQLPDYQQRKYATAPPDITRLRATMENDAVLVSWYITADSLYYLHLSRREYGIGALAWDSQMAGRVLRLHQLLNDQSGDRHLISGLIDTLSIHLVTPILPIIRDRQHLIIVPCGELLYLPFEVLHKPGDTRPLLRDLAISYSYSANLLAAPASHLPAAAPEPAESYRVLGLAPFVAATGGWPALPQSATETAGIPGTVITGKSATKTRFITELHDYPVIDLATHAIADGKDPSRSFIAFAADGSADTAGRLYEPTICQLDMSGTRLVILGACRTADGPLVSTEGVISLARAFSYAGCPGVITSLWKADDPATAYIIKRVHVYLQKGMTRDLALQKARLDYLDDPGIPSPKKEPAYWAHLVLIGDTAPIVKQSHLPAWIIPILLLLATLITAAILRKKTGRGKPRPADQPMVRDEA